MKLNTLNTIVDDILLTLRNSNIAESESVNRMQIVQWISQYRALLIKQDIDKGRDINQSYAQEIPHVRLEMEPVTGIEGSCGGYIYVSTIEIPKTIDFHFRSGLTSVVDLLGNEIQISNLTRSRYQRDRKYTSADYLAYLKNDRLYVEGPGEIEMVSVSGVFEDPLLVLDGDGNPACMNPDEPYPMPMNLLPAIKQMIFQNEFALHLPSDDINNSDHDLDNALTLNSRGHLAAR